MPAAATDVGGRSRWRRRWGAAFANLTATADEEEDAPTAKGLSETGPAAAPYSCASRTSERHESPRHSGSDGGSDERERA
jgi:hypothetical protein